MDEFDFIIFLALSYIKQIIFLKKREKKKRY